MCAFVRLLSGRCFYRFLFSDPMKAEGFTRRLGLDSQRYEVGARDRELDVEPEINGMTA
jgi:hypothetical protein